MKITDSDGAELVVPESSVIVALLEDGDLHMVMPQFNDDDIVPLHVELVGGFIALLKRNPQALLDALREVRPEQEDDHG